MPGRAIWRGVISFGMVSIPIRLYTAAQSKDIAFRQLHRDDKVRIRQRRWCPEHDAEVPSDEIAKGYEFAKDQYVILEDDDFENLPVASQHTIALTNFVPLEQIEPASFEKTYYLEPEETGTKPFALLIRALEEKGILAIGKLALRSRESLCALRASNNRLFLSTLFYADELKIDPEIDLSAVAVEQDELDIALKLIDMLTKPFQPEAETDQYRAALMERITAKIDGREIVEVKATAPAPSVDLIAALKASIEATERDGAAAKSGSNGKAARKKAPSSRKAAAKS